MSVYINGVLTLSSVVITGGSITGITDLAIADGGTGSSTAADAFTALKQAATESATGVVELATTAETVTGTDTERACTPADLTAKMAAPGAIGGTTPATETSVDNIKIDGNTISSTNANGDINLTPNGSGKTASANEIVGTNFKTIFIPASAMVSTATNGAAYAENEYATNDINMGYLAFDGAIEEYAEFQFPMPEDWDKGTIKAKFFWSSATGSTTADTVEWELAAGALSNDDAIDAALGTSQVISDALLADNRTDLQVSAATPAVTVGGTPALGDLVHFKVSRNVAGTDDMTEDAWLFGVWIQYLANTSVAAW